MDEAALRKMMVIWFGGHTWYDERKWEVMRQLYRVAAKAERREALEEAAKVCEAMYYAPEPEGFGGHDAYFSRPILDLAAAIRALIEPA